MYKIIKKPVVVLVIITLLGAFLRLYKISEFPVHLGHDEVTQLYDAISVAQTGKDTHNKFLPFIFESVHDFKPPFYTYATIIFYWIFGSREITIRLAGVVFSVLLIPAVYIFSCRLILNKTVALISSLITAISPFEIFYGRKSFENSAGLFLILIAFSLLLSFMNTKHRRYLYVSVIIFAGAMYIYFSHTVIIPLLVGTALYIYRKELVMKNIFGYIKPGLLFLILTAPLLAYIFTNPDARYRSVTVFVTADRDLGRYISYITPEQLGASLIKYKTVLEYSFNRLLLQFDPEFLFSSGLNLTNQGPIGMGALFYIQMPLILAGIYYLIVYQRSLRKGKFIAAWVFIGMIPSAVTYEPHSPHRTIMVFTMLNIISGVGLYCILLTLFKNIKFNLVKVAFTFAVILLFALNFIYFLHIYFVNYPNEKSQYLHYPFKQVAQYAWLRYNDFDAIVFDPLFGEDQPVIGTAAHYYFAYYGNYPPAKFQTEFREGIKEREVLFDKFSLRKVDWRYDQTLTKTLVIASVWSLPVQIIDKEKIEKVFYYYDQKPAFYAIRLD